MIGATWQHWNLVSEMKAEGQRSTWSLVLVVAVLVTGIGTLAVVSAFVRTGIF